MLDRETVVTVTSGLLLAICLFGIPVFNIIVGNHYTKRPPDYKSAAIGYRTPRSLKNIDTWNYAHKISGRCLFAYGFILLPCGIGAEIAFILNLLHDCLLILIMVAYTFGYFIIVIITEIMLQKKFDKTNII